MESNLTWSSGQDSTTNSQTTRSKTNPPWEHVSKERYVNGRKALICLHCKKIAKCGVFIEWNNIFLEWNEILVHVNRFLLMSNFEWKILYKSLWIPRKQPKKHMNIEILMVLMCHNLKGMWQKVKKRFKKCKVLWQLVVEKENNQQLIRILYQ